MASELEKSILSAIIYFDIFDYPLTLIEIYNSILDLSSKQCSVSLDQIRNSLDRSIILNKQICAKSGFFYLRGRDKIVAIRHNRYIIAKQKFDYARKILSILKCVPFVRAIFICNSLAYNNTKKQSDIDLVIVAKKGGVWWARFFSLIFLSMIRIRPGNKNTRNKICLSVFVDENNLDFLNLRMFKRDIDFMYWVANFYPIYDSQGLYKKFYEANEYWLQKNLINIKPIIPHPNRVTIAQPFIRSLIEFLLGPFSILASIIQRAKFPKQIKELINQDTRVRVDNGLLKFHVNDRRIEHLEMFIKKYEKVVAHNKISN